MLESRLFQGTAPTFQMPAKPNYRATETYSQAAS